jgi:hypothetical protein
VCVCACLFVCTCECVRVCEYVCVSVCVFVCIVFCQAIFFIPFVCVLTCMCVCILLCINNMCLRVHINVCVCVYSCKCQRMSAAGGEGAHLDSTFPANAAFFDIALALRLSPLSASSNTAARFCSNHERWVVGGREERQCIEEQIVFTKCGNGVGFVLCGCRLAKQVSS